MSQSKIEGLLTLNADKFQVALVEKRKQRREQVLSNSSDFCDELPLAVEVRVGDETYKQSSFELILDTGSRFLHTLREARTQNKTKKRKRDKEIVLDPDDVLEAAIVFKMLAFEAPSELTAAQIASVIKSLSYINATDALDAMACYLPVALDSSTVTALLAAVMQHSVTSSLLQHLCQALDAAFSDLQPDAVNDFWQALAPVASVPLCKQLEERSGLVGRWLWRCLDAVLCEGDNCPAHQAENRILLPTERFPSLHDHLSHFLRMCGSRWCECCLQQAMCLSTQGRLDRVGEAVVVSQTAMSLALAAKVAKSANKRTQGVGVSLAGLPHGFAILTKPTLKDGEAVQGKMGIFLCYTGLPAPHTTYKATFSLFTLQGTWAVLSGCKAAGKQVGPYSTDLPRDKGGNDGWGFSSIAVPGDACDHVLMFVEIQLHSNSQS